MSRYHARTGIAVIALGLLGAACTPAVGAPDPAGTSGARPGASDGTRAPWSWDDWAPVALGEIRLFGGNFAPEGWLPADGRSLSPQAYTGLASVLGTTFGGDGLTTLNLPSLPPVGVGGTQRQYLIAVEGRLPGYTGKGEGLESGLIGEVRLWPLDKLPQGWLACDGATLPIESNEALFSVLGTTYGGDGETTFKLPQLSNVGPARYLINGAGKFPGRHEGDGQPMTDPIYGQIGLFAGSWVPKGWAACDGRQARLQDNLPLFSLIGTTFGGDGRTTFALPKMTFETQPSLRYAIALRGIFPKRP